MEISWGKIYKDFIYRRKPTPRESVGFFGWLYELRISYECTSKKRRNLIFANYLPDPLEFFRNFSQIKAGEKIH